MKSLPSVAGQPSRHCRLLEMIEIEGVVMGWRRNRSIREIGGSVGVTWKQEDKFERVKKEIRRIQNREICSMCEKGTQRVLPPTHYECLRLKSTNILLTMGYREGFLQRF